MDAIFSASRCRNPLCIVVPPLVEFVFMRVFFRYFLGIKMGYVAITDYDFVFTGCFAFVVLMMALERKARLTLSLNKSTLTINILALTSFIAISIYFEKLTALHPVLFLNLWLVTALSTLISATFLFVRPAYFFWHKEKKFILPAILAGLSGIIAKMLYPLLWKPVAIASGYAVCGLLKPFMSTMSCQLKQSLMLHGSSFTLAVGTACSGLDSVVFFLFSIGLISICDWKRFSPKTWLGLYLYGAFFMLALNVVRISMFFVFSTWAHQWFGNTTGVLFTLTIFHQSIGWFIFGSGLAIFLGWMYREPWHSLDVSAVRFPKLLEQQEII